MCPSFYWPACVYVSLLSLTCKCVCIFLIFGVLVCLCVPFLFGLLACMSSSFNWPADLYVFLLSVPLLFGLQVCIFLSCRSLCHCLSSAWLLVCIFLLYVCCCCACAIVQVPASSLTWWCVVPLASLFTYVYLCLRIA
jgi:hypothetical protein